MRDEPVFFIHRFDHTPIIDFPETQTERIGGSVSLPHRVRCFQRIAHHDERFQSGQNVQPERQCQTVARIFPAPHACRIKSFDQQFGFHAQRIQARVFEVFVNPRRQIPRAAKSIQQFVVYRHEPEMFPEALWIIGLRGHQCAFRTKVEPAGVQ